MVSSVINLAIIIGSFLFIFTYIIYICIRIY
uniref:Uncharacterized protein n=1 Tax=Myoviridae sp. ctcyQ27 TaxID=2825139 RepID=A0A8S5UFB4_9CAUD|nr:MAG TPA: hypothetical protein [Myoviridae sp. ctcyQ27]